uniref:Uncharacterized protein n=1 Tax=Arundo donax TaxID=35708 RepID=A0A0A9B7K9_ARUDO
MDMIRYLHLTLYYYGFGRQCDLAYSSSEIL